jgi:dissimilatory sulfite reductase (desulfoviridin) alpha/beta subunit
MTKDEIQALAYKAQIKPMLVDGRWGITNMEVFVDLLLREEREACAKVCDDRAMRHYESEAEEELEACAASIRARNNVQQEPQK